MANYLSSARENFNSFGASLASIQQNAQDDANTNSQNADIYQQTVAQLKLEAPQAFVFGGMEAIRQSTDLYNRITTVVAQAKELPSTLTGIGKNLVAKLSARQQQAKDLYDTAKTKLSGTLEDVQAHASSVASQAKGVFSDATLSLKDSANLDELKSNFSSFKSDLTDRLSKANDIIDSNVKQYSDIADQAKSQIGEIQGKLDALKSSATGELTGLAKDQYDALAAKLPDLQGQVDKATSFIASANETRDTFAKQVADQISQQGEKAKAQFADISSKLSPEELRTQLGLPAPAAPSAAAVPSAERLSTATTDSAGNLIDSTTQRFLTPSGRLAPPAPAAAPPTLEPTVAPTIEPPTEIIPSATEGGGGLFSRIGDMFRTKTTNTLQTARNAQDQLMEFDPESSGIGRGFITSTNEQIARFVSPAADEASATAARLAGNFPRGPLESGIITPDVTGAGVRVLPTVPALPSVPEVPAAATSALEEVSSVGNRLLGAAGNAAGIFGGVQAGMDAARGQFNANDAANAFFGVEAGKSLGESAISGIKTAASSLGEQLSGASAAAGNLLNATQETGSKVITSLQQSADQALTAGRNAISATQDVIGGAVKTGTEAATAAASLGKAAVSDVAESVAEASSAVIPIVGEVAGIGLAGYQIYEGFKDLFTHPSAPTPIAVPTVANISQGFQSGI